jgi:hypothetical protein
MNNNEKRFPEQEAPEKNTDDAFVQVGKDGHPVMPEAGGENREPKTGEAERASEEKR